MRRTLYLTWRSPYARKIQILLAEKGLPYEAAGVDLQAKPPEFLALGPVAKVPVLVEEEAGEGGGRTVVCDSTVIAEHLEERYPEPPMYGAGWRGRLASRGWEDLGDSLSDAAIQAFFGKQRGEAAAAAKAEAMIGRLLDHAEAALADLPAGFGVAQASLLSALGYLGFRHGEGWRATHPALAAWFDAQHARPSVEQTRPRM